MTKHADNWTVSVGSRVVFEGPKVKARRVFDKYAKGAASGGKEGMPASLHDSFGELVVEQGPGGSYVSSGRGGASRKTKGTVNPDTLVYSAAAWWRDCDAFVSVVGLSKKKVEQALRSSIREEAKNAREDEFQVDKEDRRYHSVTDAMDDIAWSGAFDAKLADVVSDRNMDEAISDLESSGIHYAEVG